MIHLHIIYSYYCLKYSVYVCTYPSMYQRVCTHVHACTAMYVPVCVLVCMYLYWCVCWHVDGRTAAQNPNRWCPVILWMVLVLATVCYWIAMLWPSPMSPTVHIHVFVSLQLKRVTSPAPQLRGQATWNACNNDPYIHVHTCRHAHGWRMCHHPKVRRYFYMRIEWLIYIRVAKR